VDHVLQPIVGNYFRNSAQNYSVLDFLSARAERQLEAAKHIKIALQAYDVEAIDALIGDIHPPEMLMQTLTDRKLAEEQKKTYEVQEMAQQQRQQLVRETSLADIQQEVVRSEQGVNIAELQAQSTIKQAEGEAESIRLRAAGEADAIRGKGEAQAAAYKVGAEAMGSQGFTAVQLMNIVGEQGVRIIPDILVNGGEGGNASMVEALLGVILSNQMTTLNGASATSDGSEQNGRSKPAALPAPSDGKVMKKAE
jgi:uncharacterized membrane protein YqiK